MGNEPLSRPIQGGNGPAMLAITFSDVRTKCPDVLKMVRQSQNLVGYMQSCFRPLHGMVPDISIKPRSEYQYHWPGST